MEAVRRAFKWADGLGAATALVALVAAAMSASQFVRVRDEKAAVHRFDDEMRSRSLPSRSAVKALEDDIAAARAELRGLNKLVALNSARIDAPTTDAGVQIAEQFATMRAALRNEQVETAAVRKKIDALESKLQGLEGIIVEKPEKALRLPLMERDLDALERRLDAGLAVAKSENERAYDLMKWAFGVMGLVSLGLLGTAIGNVFKKSSDS